jgi:hypothetical protein
MGFSTKWLYDVANASIDTVLTAHRRERLIQT